MPKKNYYCKKCNREHRKGSKIWKKHKKYKKYNEQNKKNIKDVYDEDYIEKMIEEIEKENKNDIKKNDLESVEKYNFEIPQNKVSYQKAPFWKRTLAYLIDCLFFYLIPFQIFMMIYLPKVGLGFDDMSEFEKYIMSSPELIGLLFIGLVSTLFIFLLYFMLVEKNFKTSIGKKLLKLKIKSKNKLTYKDVFIRNITKTIFVFLLPIDLFGISITGQRFTEKIAGTKVIYYVRLLIIREPW